MTLAVISWSDYLAGKGQISDILNNPQGTFLNGTNSRQS